MLMSVSKKRSLERSRRAARVRKTITGTTERPRLCVRRSVTHIYAQIVDDVQGKTVAQVGSCGKEFAQKVSGKKLTKTEESKLVGELIAEKGIAAGVKNVVFDRKGYLYHGRVKALAEAARSKGLVF